MPPPSRFQTGLSAIRGSIYVLLYLAVLVGGGCSESIPPSSTAGLGYSPVFIDDADRSSLVKATEHHLSYLRKLPHDTVVTIGGDPYTIGWLQESLCLFLDIINHNPPPAELDRIIREKFTVYQAGGRQNAPAGEMLITGYYLPLLEGSLVKKSPFLHPLYKKPDSLHVRKDQKSGKDIIGRIDNRGNIVPFWTRAEIEDTRVLAGNELVYLKDPVDAFFLQIQGSGRIKLRDGSIRSVHFSASNGHEYKSIGKLLVDEQKITKEDISMQTIKQYLQEHRSEIKRILHTNGKYVFFKWEDSEPKGSLGEALTPGRSIAVDREALPAGALAYIITQRPVIDPIGTVTGWEPLRRFVLPQDSGAAIKGTGRADVFWGDGLYAETAAGHMKEKGHLYFLVKKKT
jgi:membrane-bound lytic murein transglycosylase A